MKNFSYTRAESIGAAVSLLAQNVNSKFLGGGTNLVDLMREHVEQPDALIDVSRLEAARLISEVSGGGVTIGAAAKNTAIANHPLIRERYPVLSQAILFGASGQIRNMATAAGNLMQRTRCYYFYDQAARCNKRVPGAGCDAIDGFNRMHAILGTSDKCIATHPSDMCVALAALNAVVNVEGPAGKRAIAFQEFHRLPGETPELETELRPGELITSIQLPEMSFATNSLYRKVRDRASYAFALVSVAAVLEMSGGVIQNVHIALGGVAHKPWRASKAEEALQGTLPGETVFKEAAALEMAGAEGFGYNNFKIELAQRTIVDVLSDLAISGGKK